MSFNRVYEFVCDRWLAADEEDGKTTVFLYPGLSSKSADPGVPYIVNIFTGDKKNASTSAKVFVELFGGESGKESSGKIMITDAKFERNKVDKVTIESPKMLSPLYQILVGHDNSGGGQDGFLTKLKLKPLALE